jgi:hypothetical protein
MAFRIHIFDLTLAHDMVFLHDEQKLPLLAAHHHHNQQTMGDKDARVNLSLDELSRLLRSVQAPKVPKSGS